MRAARMVDVGRMECEEVPVPALGDADPAADPAADPSCDVVVRSEMASICGSDLHIVMLGAGVNHRLPCPHGYPGHEGIGEVVESRAPHLPTGTRVLTFPNVPEAECFSEYQRLGAAYCVPLPTTAVPRAHLLMAQQLGTVVFARRRRPRDVAGETVAVVGQGSAGLFFTFLLKRAGAARVVVSDLSDARLAMAQEYGADVCVNAGRDSLADVVADLTAGRGADYVVEAVGRADTFLSCVDLVRTDGELLWFGLPSVDDDIPVGFQRFFRKRLRAAAVYGAQDEPGAMSFRQALALIADGRIDVAPLLSHVFGIDRIGDAMRLAHEPHDAGALKVSVEFD
ncbi:MAG TPA: zinc-binding alcohol dehydrogenase [Acidimicrobiaceae bacterium]|nr:zinc-binding alcohol dehydrogenase [Acidimicrobiaceae bacterium]